MYRTVGKKLRGLPLELLFERLLKFQIPSRHYRLNGAHTFAAERRESACVRSCRVTFDALSRLARYIRIAKYRLELAEESELFSLRQPTTTMTESRCRRHTGTHFIARAVAIIASTAQLTAGSHQWIARWSHF